MTILFAQASYPSPDAAATTICLKLYLYIVPVSCNGYTGRVSLHHMHMYLASYTTNGMNRYIVNQRTLRYQASKTGIAVGISYSTRD